MTGFKMEAAVLGDVLFFSDLENSCSDLWDLTFNGDEIYKDVSGKRKGPNARKQAQVLSVAVTSCFCSIKPLPPLRVDP